MIRSRAARVQDAPRAPAAPAGLPPGP